MEIAQRSAGIKQVTDFGSDDFDVYVICVSTHKLEERWWTSIDRKHYTKGNIKESVRNTQS